MTILIDHQQLKKWQSDITSRFAAAGAVAKSTPDCLITSIPAQRDTEVFMNFLRSLAGKISPLAYQMTVPLGQSNFASNALRPPVDVSPNITTLLLWKEATSSMQYSDDSQIAMTITYSGSSAAAAAFADGIDVAV
jgi:hypothetical protein